MMTHFDEHTIELYLLGDEKVATHRSEIEEHLKKCYSCRELAEELGQFHNMVRGTQPLLKEHVDIEASTSLELKPEYIQRNRFRGLRPVVSSVPARVWQFARKRPVVSGVMVCSAFALLFISLNYRLLTKDDTAVNNKNPDYSFLNTQSNALEIFNKNDQLLWTVPVSDAQGYAKSFSQFDANHTLIVDLNGNGSKTVVTRIPHKKDHQSGIPELKMYNGLRNLINTIRIGDIPIRYKGIEYNLPYDFLDFLFADIKNQPQKQLWYSASNTRSPSFFAIASPSGEVQGRYWHFGFIPKIALDTISVNGITQRRVILSSTNDTEDHVGNYWAEFIILDPNKIRGDCEATTTRGFGYPSTDAERLCFRLPKSDIEVAENIPLSNALNISTGMPFIISPSQSEVNFSYCFSKDFKILDVKYSTQVPQIHKNLKQQGKVKSTFNQSYLIDLKNRVEYWNGKRWQTDWTMVNHKD